MNTPMQTKAQTRRVKLKHHRVNAPPVFIVEDNPMYSFMLTYTLEQEFNFNICNFDSGEDCLLNLEQYRPAIIILDYKLKNMNGVNVLQYVKRNFPEIYVIVITEQKNIHTAVEIMKRGAFDYIPKSQTSLHELTHSIEKVFAEMEANEKVKMN